MEIGYNITNDPTLLNKQNAITPELAVKLERFHKMALEGKESSIPKLLQAIDQYPKNPQLKNYLSVLYSTLGNVDKTYEVNHWLLAEHPNYLFAKLNLANEYCLNKQFNKVPEVLGEAIELGSLYPERDTFHINEVTGFFKTAILYFTGIGNLEQAEIRYKILQELAPDSADTDFALKILFTARMEAGMKRHKEEQKTKIIVETAKQKVTKKSIAPTFTHSEINELYCNDLNTIDELLPRILELPRKSLIADLELVLQDSIDRYTFFSKKHKTNDLQEGECMFLIHAMFILGELEAIESLEKVFAMMSQSEDFMHMYFGDFLCESMWEPLYKIASNKLEVCKQFMYKPNTYTYSKTTIADMVEQIAHHQPQRRIEVIQWYREACNFFAQSSLQDNVIDSDVIGLLICNILDINADELLPEIEALYGKNMVSKGICGTLESVQESFSRPISHSHKRALMNIHERYVHITTTWAGYTEDEDSVSSPFGDFTPSIMPIRAEPKIERNAPCPCGSGKKYKKCCLKN